MGFFSVENIALTILGYNISYIELFATILGLTSVYYATNSNRLTWVFGLFNIFLLFSLFYQIHLYGDMLLQVYYLYMTFYGWYKWNENSEDNTFTNVNNKIPLCLGFVLLYLVAVFSIVNLHIYLPNIFNAEASYPIYSTLVFTLSVFATILLVHRKIESWYLWIISDIICIIIYYKKGMYFLSLQYTICLMLAIRGLYRTKRLNNA